MKVLKIVTLTLLIGAVPSLSYAHGGHEEGSSDDRVEQQDRRAPASKVKHGDDEDSNQDATNGRKHRHGTDDSHDDKDGE